MIFILRLYCCFIYYTVFLSDAVPKILVNEKNNLNISLCLLFVESVAVIKGAPFDGIKPVGLCWVKIP